VLGGGKRDIDRLAGGDAGVVVRSVQALINAGDHASIRKCNRELHSISAGLQIAEEIVARAVGRGGADDGASAVEEVHRDTLDARFTTILLPLRLRSIQT
jgi:hypothetical protein